MIKDYIVKLTLLIIFPTFVILNNVHASSSPSSSSSSSPATVTPSPFQKNAGAAIPILETGVQNYLTAKETDDLNYGLHLMPTGTNTAMSTTPQIQFLTDYVRSSCNASSLENNMPECSNSTGIYTILRPSNIFNSINYTSPTDPVLNASVGVIHALIEPFPDPQLNTLLQDTANFSKNENDIANLIAAQAPIMMAKNSLNGILARRYVDPAIASQLPSGYNSSSITQIMHDESLRRLTDQTWFTGLNNLSQNQLIIELLEVEAFKLWMEYNKFQQNERIEALLATLVAAQSGQSSAMSGLIDSDTKNTLKDAKNKNQQIQNSVPSQYLPPTPPTTP